MVFEGNILAATDGEVFEGVSAEDEDGGDEDGATDGSVVQLQTGQSGAVRVNDAEEDLIESVVAGLTGANS